MDKNAFELLAIDQKLTVENPHDYLENFVKEIDLPMPKLLKVLFDINVKNYPESFTHFWTYLNDLHAKIKN